MRDRPRPKIAVTMGDPAGVGPELCLRLLAEESVLRECVPVVFGSAAVLERAAETCSLPLPARILREADGLPSGTHSFDSYVLDFGAPCQGDISPGEVRPEYGQASFRYVEAAIDAACRHDVDAVVTCPVHKEAFRAAGIAYPGHTEIFTDRAGTGRTCMMMTSDNMTVSLVTAHVGYREASERLGVERILDVIELTAETMTGLRKRAVRISVCGLNPHAGEHGLFGTGEEERYITPAIHAARERGIQVDGPLPPDTAFVPARLDSVDAVVCMYHDQGLIPFKMRSFDCGVNVTLGLSIIRTSVDHGTAFDIAWKGIANPGSLFAACRLAVELKASRQWLAGS